jgi:hypothetical protein
MLQLERFYLAAAAYRLEISRGKSPQLLTGRVSSTLPVNGIQLETD